MQIARHEMVIGAMAEMLHRGRVAVMIAPCGDTEGFGQQSIERRGFDEQPNDLLEQERIAVAVGIAVERAEIVPVDPEEARIVSFVGLRAAHRRPPSELAAMRGCLGVWISIAAGGVEVLAFGI